MLVSERALKWAMRFYPPLFFQRIWVLEFGEGFSSVKVKISKSILNTNYNKSIFGGTIFSATDPFYPALFHQILKRSGLNVKLWSKQTNIQFIKPGTENLYFSIYLSKEMIDEAIESLNTSGKFIKTFTVEVTNRNGDIFAITQNEIYIKKSA